MSDDETFEDYRKPFLWALYVIAIGLTALSAYLFWAGRRLYVSETFFERDLNILGGNETWMVPALFAVPLLAQFVGLLYLPLTGHRDKSITLFYAFCLSIIAVSSCGYCYLWSSYTNELVSQQAIASYYANCALTLICILLFFVGLMTYVIRRDKTRSALLAPGDIKDVELFCKKLVQTQGSNFNELHEKVAGALFPVLSPNQSPTPLQTEVTDVANGAVAADGLKLKLVEEINGKAVTDEDFYNDSLSLNSVHAHHAFGQFPRTSTCKLALRDRERCVRRILDHFLRNDIRRTRYYIPWFVENIFNDLKDGVAKTHFWALVFFFTVFLSITYLFAFAFAFDDKKTLNASGVPALYMARNRPSDVLERRPDAAQAAPSAGLAWPDYVFYYTDPQATGPALATQPFDAAAYEDLRRKRAELTDANGRFTKLLGELNDKKSTFVIQRNSADGQDNYDESRRLNGEIQKVNDQLTKAGNDLNGNNSALQENTAGMLKLNKAWRERENDNNLRLMLDAIDTETGYGGGVLIELRSGGAPAQATSAAEGSLPEERRQGLKYLLLERLAQGKGVPSSIHWLDVYGDSTPAGANNGTPREWRTLQQLLTTTQCDDLANMVENRLGKKDADLLRKQFSVISDFNNRRQIASGNELKLRNELDHLLTLVPAKDGPRIEEETYKRKLSQTLAAFRETSESLVLDPSVPDAGGDSIIVSVRPLLNQHHAIPLGLMDYVYFTVYTITTTGYGDIVPTTTYAKFLCTFANIIEVFFLVVFFNALLSVRRP